MLLCNDVSHWLVANRKSALEYDLLGNDDLVVDPICRGELVVPPLSKLLISISAAASNSTTSFVGLFVCLRILGGILLISIG